MHRPKLDSVCEIRREPLEQAAHHFWNGAHIAGHEDLLAGVQATGELRRPMESDDGFARPGPAGDARGTVDCTVDRSTLHGREKQHPVLDRAVRPAVEHTVHARSNFT